MSDVRPDDPGDFEDPLNNYEPTEYGNELERTLVEVPAREIAGQPSAQIGLKTTVREAVQTLQRLQVSSLLVVDEGHVAGIFTERDVLERVADNFASLAQAPVSEVMTSDPLVVYGSDPSGTALAAIAAAGYRHVPLLSVDGKLLGIVSPRRVLAFLAEHFED